MPKEKSTFLTCKSDRVFRTIFCNREHPDLMIGLLERILQEKIYSFEFLNDFLPISHTKERTKTVDALMLVNNKYIHLELNSCADEYIHFRNFAMFGNIVSKNGLRGKMYDPKLQFIHIDISFNLSKNEDDQMDNTINDYKKEYIHNLLIVEFNMDKIMSYWYNNDTKKIEKYKHLIVLDLPKEELKKVVEKEDDEFMVYVGKSVLDLNDQERYSPLVTPEEDIMLLKNTYKHVGLEEGRAEGLAEGQEQKAKTTALNMLREKFDIPIIARMTELSEQEVKALQATL